VEAYLDRSYPDGSFVYSHVVNEMKKTYQVWSEGYMATGEHGLARLMGTVTAESFVEACQILAKEKEWGDLFRDPCSIEERPSYWACRLFPTEHEAREFCG